MILCSWVLSLALDLAFVILMQLIFFPLQIALQFWLSLSADLESPFHKKEGSPSSPSSSCLTLSIVATAKSFTEVNSPPQQSALGKGSVGSPREALVPDSLALSTLLTLCSAQIMSQRRHPGFTHSEAEVQQTP